MNAFVQDIEKLLLRDLGKLEQEILEYDNEQQIWQKSGSIANTAGNLCLHLCGNLQHYIGSVLGHTPYRRNREAEFNCTFLERARLVAEINQTRDAVTHTLPQLHDEHLRQDYPVQVFQQPMTTRFFLVHLATHLNYHLGQINYHRRLTGPAAAG